jgi:dephospho-CoA kinase
MAPRPLQIGITGGIGSGKSLVSKIFSVLGIPVYDADSHAKELMTTDGILVSGIKKEFGDLSYHTNGALNREYLAQHVFTNEEKLKVLNALVHPRVAVDYDQWVKKQQAEVSYVLKEAALLFEAASHKTLDKIIVVYAPLEMRIQRVLKRDAHRSVEQIKAIVEKQMPEDEKLKRADYIVVNDETQLVTSQVISLHEKFLRNDF